MEFRKNLLEGIEYYRQLLPQMVEETEEARQRFLLELMAFKKKLEEMIEERREIFTENLVTVAA